MPVTIEVTNGLLVGQRSLVRLGQVVRVGRTEWADLAIRGDRSLAEVHFAVEYDASGCRVRDLGEWGLFVNGEATPQANLKDGDQLRAGDTTFRVRIQDDSPASATTPTPRAAKSARKEPAARSGDDAPAAPYALAATVVSRYVATDDAKRLLKSDDSPRQFVDALVQKGLLADAARFLAFAVPPREGVWWACLATREALAASAPVTAQTALVAAELWAADPSEGNRRAAHAAAEAAGLDNAAGWAAMAAFWSGGSIAPIGLADVPAHDGLTPQAVSAAVTLAVTARPAAEMAAAYARAITAGLDAADGKRRWPEKKK